MGKFKTALRSLTHKICQDFQGLEIPNRSIWTLYGAPDGPPHVALDTDRPAYSDLRYSLTVGLLKMPEYRAAADVIANDPKLKKGIIVDDSGRLVEPEETNMTRALLTNFLWLYLREGTDLEWSETRFDIVFEQLVSELDRRSIVVHTTLPLSNIKMEIDSLDFGDELRLEPASITELETWLNPERGLPPIGGGPPRWDSHYIDRPAVLHLRQTVVGQPVSTSTMGSFQPQVNPSSVITALRLVMNAPTSVIFQQHNSEGLMAFGGLSTGYGGSQPLRTPLVTLDEENAKRVIQIWQVLQTNPNAELLRIPLRRWETSLSRRDLEDKLIDAWISLEALLQIDKELSFRAALRLAEFLGTSGPHKKKDIYDKTKLSYDWRSAIVHGGKTKKLANRQSLEETVQLTTDWLREALLKVLALNTQFNPRDLEIRLLNRETKVL